MDWFRWWHGTLTDPKFRWIARKSGCSFTSVITVWVAMLERASNVAGGDATVTRGDVAGFDCDAHDALLDVEDGTCARILSAFIEKGLVADGRIANWETRQPKREDSSAERTRAYRERQAKDSSSTGGDAHVTQCDASERNVTIREEEIRGEESRENLNPTNPSGLVVASDADDHPQADKNPKKRDCPHQEIIAAYHEILPTSPAIRDWTPARAAHLRARWNEDARHQSIEWWRRFFTYISGSGFLTGKVGGANRKPFTPGLEWICKADNFAKIREGRFHDAEAA